MLASDVEREREAATRELVNRVEAGPLLRRAAKAKDPEVVRRVQSILEAIGRRRAPVLLEKARRDAKEGRVDLATERLVRLGTLEREDARWEVALELGAKLLAMAKGLREDIGVYSDTVPLSLSFEKYKKQLAPAVAVGRNLQLLRSEGPYLACGEMITARGRTGGGVMLCTGDVTLHTCGPCLILSCGAVRLDCTFASVVVCDGDFVSKDCMRALVIARGAVKIPFGTQKSVVLSGNTVHNAQDMKRLQWGNTVGENERMPLEFVTFFDPNMLGVEVNEVNGAVQVHKVDAKKAFGIADVRSADIVLSVDDVAVESVAAFRRALRTAVALDEDCLLRLRRAGKIVEIVIPISK
jgi:hypothetical protein